MKIICNGKEKSALEGITIEGLLVELDLNPDTVVVECNKKIILREEYHSHVLSDDDVLELIRFVGCWLRTLEALSESDPAARAESGHEPRGEEIRI